MKSQIEIEKRILEIEQEKEMIQLEYLVEKTSNGKDLLAERNVQKSMMINNLKWVLS